MLVHAAPPRANGSATSGWSISNTVLDIVLGELNRWNTLDPVELPNMTTYFLAFWKFTGKVMLSRGMLTGLSTLARTGDADIQASITSIVIKAELVAGPLYVSYVGIVRFLSLGQAVTIEAEASDLRVSIIISK